MKLSRRRYSIQLSSCVVFLIFGGVTRVCPQTPSPALIELKTCGTELSVFDDGTVVKSRDGKKTERRLSESQMRKVRKLVASSPCEKRWRPSAQAPKKPPRGQPKFQLVSNDDCISVELGYGPGLQQVWITRHYANYTRGVLAYIPCGYTEANSQQYINRKWQRFLSQLVDALGAKNFLASCGCLQSDNLLDEKKPPVYITFERLEEQSVLLRIHNNTRTPIRVPTEPGCISAQANVGPCRDRGILEITEGRRVIMKYHVEDDTGTYHFVGNTLSRLPSGSSAVFLVAQSQLGKLDIYVPFIYEWDDMRDMFDDDNHWVGDPKIDRRVSFTSYDFGELMKKK